MFGFSIGKIVVLVAVLIGVYMGFKLLGRINAMQRRSDDDSSDTSRVETVYDPETETYVPRETKQRSEKD